MFRHDSSKIFKDYESIRKEIEELSDELAEKSGGISDTSIILKIFSPSLPNLTLVDLPGLPSVPLTDQSSHTEKHIREMVLDYIENPYSIILAVTPANSDITASNSLKIAREVDPDGTRTLVVLTKLDLMEPGTDAWDMLQGKVVSVNLGIIGVVNQTQNDEEESVEESLAREAAFFQHNYKSIESKHGITYLTRTVQAMLVNHINSCMPELKESICQLFVAKEIEFKQMDDSKSEPYEPTRKLHHLITKFTNSYINAIRGYSLNKEENEICGRAKINHVFQEVLKKDIRIALKSFSDRDMKNTVFNTSGIHPSISIPETAFELFAKKQIEQFRIPALKCVQLVHVELNNIAQNCLSDKNLQMDHYPCLKSVLGQLVTELLQRRLPVTNESVNSFIDIQTAHINTSHPDFLSQQTQPVAKVDESNKTVASQALCSGDALKVDKSHFHYALVSKSLNSYIPIVSKIVEDTVPKIIMHYMVNFVIDHLQETLVRQIQNIYGNNIKFLLSKSQEVIRERDELEIEVTKLSKAVAIISTLNNMN